jgi:hypothetical protein
VKEQGDEGIIRIISGVGVPVLVAADTSPPSSFVEKIAARLNVRVYHPKESMKKAEKKEIGALIDDVHIRDSYAAAVKAYRKYQNRLRQIEAMKAGDKEELKKMVIIGQRIGDHIQENLTDSEDLVLGLEKWPDGKRRRRLQKANLYI